MPSDSLTRHPNWDGPRKTRFYGNILLIGLLWFDLFLNLSLEWRLNPQYSYGYLVPFLGLYLLYSRWENRPPVTPPSTPRWALPTLFILALLALFPLRLVFEANPDWRLLMWGHAAGVTMLTMAFTYRVGGVTWLIHFFWVWIFLLVSVPWPTRIEAPLIQGLMRLVASVSVEWLNLLGIHARQSGNLIRLPNTLVGVEEACSGVRSFQSAIMAAFFFGEFYRFRIGYRLGLIAGGVLLSIFLNLMRTFLLTWIAHHDGADAMSHWHDPVGYFVYFGSFACIFLLSVSLQKRARAPISYPASGGPRIKGSSRGLLALPVVAVCISIGLLGWIGNILYYRLNENPPEFHVAVRTAYENLDQPVRSLTIPDAVQAQLRYQEGEQVVWADRSKSQVWNVFFFTWDKGDISSFVGVHRPEICLQAAGLVLSETGPRVTWSSEPFQMVMNSYTFRSGDQLFHVFFAVWEKENGRRVPINRDHGDRLSRVREGVRSAARQSLEIVVTGTPSLEVATEEARTLLDRVLKVDIRDPSRLSSGDGY